MFDLMMMEMKLVLLSSIVPSISFDRTVERLVRGGIEESRCCYHSTVGTKEIKSARSTSYDSRECQCSACSEWGKSALKKGIKGQRECSKSIKNI